jgi:hypothetical protein
LTYDASAIRQDPNLFLPEADSKDPVVPVCHQHTPAIGYLAIKSHPVCPIICHVMTQYQLLLSQKVTFLCSIIHLVMT